MQYRWTNLYSRHNKLSITTFFKDKRQKHLFIIYFSIIFEKIKMNEEIDEAEFYHQDFTTASEWELFISRIEEVIREWKIQETKDSEKQVPLQGQWWCRSEDVHFADITFQLSSYKHKSINSSQKENDEDDADNGSQLKNPIDTDFDFVLDDGDTSNTDKCIASWYGLKEYIVLTAHDSSVIVSPSPIKILLSSVTVAVANTGCEIPIFVQIRDKWQRLYLGVYEGNAIRTNYDMIHLGKCPQHCRYLSGLLDLFKTKIMSPTAMDPIVVSVQLTYHLTDFGKYIWKQDVLDMENSSFDTNSLTILPFGVSYDPISCIILKTTWSQLPDHLIVDTEIYSDLNPMQAPQWSVSVKMSEQPICLLADCLTEFIQLLNINLTVYDVLGDFVTPINSTPENNPLDVLTEPHIPTISAVLKRATRSSSSSATIRTRKSMAPIAEDNLEPLIYFLFPDAETQPQFPYTNEKFQKDRLNDENVVSDKKNYENIFRGYKTCGYDSLVWRLAIVLAQAAESLGGTKALAHLWYEFSQEMRYRWEKSYLIPGLTPGFPDPRTCLLHQKLQMLNYCIERRISRETKLSGSGRSFESVEDTSTDDEEFYDCDIENDDESNGKNRENYSLWNQPIGRLSKFKNLKLLVTGEELYIPITQDPGPKTEDQLQEDTDFLLKLGSDPQGSELRAKMMSASLLSDMESFKAANPGSILEDFIRWYSPRDWIEEGEEVDEWGQKRGRLSSRMLISDNTWVEMWQSAKPVPANRQRRLFDDTREAEKVLHFLDSRNLAEIAELLLPILFHTSIYRLVEECEQIKPLENSDILRQIIKTGERISREGGLPKRRCELLIQEIATVELSMSQINSLLYKFNPAGEYDEQLAHFVECLTKGVEMEVADKFHSKTGGNLLTMFSEAQKVANMILAEYGTVGSDSQLTENAIFPQPAEREFVMRVSTCRPAIYSAKSPQFLRAILSKNEFRLCGAFSEDIVFF